MNLTNPFSTPSLPGGAGPAQAGQPVVYDPATGLYVNQTTGAVSTDPGGQHPVQSASLATQAARNIAVSNNLMAQLATYGKQYTQALGGQTKLVGDLQGTINGTAPSVAQGQLEAGLGQTRSALNSEAAGATGTNAALARETAMQATAGADANTNQQAAQLRAQEVQGAEQAQGTVLGQEAGEASGMYGANLSAAGAASAAAGSEEGQRETANMQGQQQQNQLEFNLLNGIGQDAAKASTGGGTATSDRREKTDVKKLGDSDMEQLLSKIAGYGGQYKHPGTDGEAPGNRIFGGMAQDIQKGGPLGKEMVIQGKPLKLDLPNAVGAALAAVAYLKKRIDAEHGRKAA